MPQARYHAQRFPRYGYRRITAMLKREGRPMNRKRVQRGTTGVLDAFGDGSIHISLAAGALSARSCRSSTYTCRRSEGTR